MLKLSKMSSYTILLVSVYNITAFGPHALNVRTNISSYGPQAQLTRAQFLFDMKQEFGPYFVIYMDLSLGFVTWICLNLN